MHELTICQRLVDAVQMEVARLPAPPPRLVSVRVRVGCLRLIVPETLRCAYEILARDTVAAGSSLEIVATPATGCCRACGWEGDVTPDALRCRSCGAGALTLTGGKELRLEALEVEADDNS